MTKISENGKNAKILGLQTSQMIVWFSNKKHQYKLGQNLKTFCSYQINLLYNLEVELWVGYWRHCCVSIWLGTKNYVVRNKSNQFPKSDYLSRAYIKFWCFCELPNTFYKFLHDACKNL